MLPFLQRRWFLFALATLLGLGFAWPQAMLPAARSVPQDAVVAIVLFMMALPLEARSMFDALRRPTAVIVALVMNMVVMPLAAVVAAMAVPADLGAGLLIAGAIPCTMASAAAWTRRAGGNDTVALLVMMITNLLCFVVAPGWLWLTTGSQIDLDPWSMVRRLALLAVLPTVAAQMLRLHRPIGQWAGRHKLALGVLSQCGILSTVFVGAVSSGMYLRGSDGSADMAATTWLVMLAAVAGMHLSVLWLGIATARRLGLSPSDQVAVGFSGSQKTLMVGILIAQEFPPVAILPLVAYHVFQLLLDTVVADRWRDQYPNPTC